MKALTLTQPWASLVALGHKRVETRSWATNYRGPLAIHAAKGFPASARDFASEERALGRLPERLPLGAIVAVAVVTDVGRTEHISPVISALERHLGDYTPGRYAWMLRNIRPLPEPVPLMGRLGLFHVPGDTYLRIVHDLLVSSATEPHEGL